MKTKFEIVFWSLGLLVIMLSCRSNREEIAIYEPHPFFTTDNFSDKIFVTDNIRAIIFDDNDYYFLDKKSTLVIRTDKDLNLITTYGRKGRGPGETIYMDSFAVGEENLYTEGNGNTIHIFDKNDQRYLSSIEREVKVGGVTISSRLLEKNNGLIGCFTGEYTAQGTPVVEIDFSGNVVKASEGTVIGESEKARATTDRDIFRLKNGGFLSVVRNAPIVDLYNSDMDYIKSIDISKVNLVGERIEQIEQQKKKQENPNTVYYIVSDSYYSNDKLYLLCYSPNEAPQGVDSNTIVEMELRNNELIHVRNIKLPGRWYHSICITPDNSILTAANTLESCIEQFEL